jgi:PAS domain S-box-containing protein
MSLLDPELNELADALRSAPFGAAITSVDGTFLHTNVAWCAMLGCDERWLIGRPLSDVIVGDPVGTAAHFRDLLATGTQTGRRTLRRQDGALVDIECTCTVVRDRAGRASYVIGYAQDVRAAAAPVPPFEQAFAAAPVGMAMLDASFRFRWVNAALARILAVSAERLVGRAYIEFVHPDDRAASAATLQRLDGGEITGGEQERRIRDATGRTLHLRVEGSRIADDLYFCVFVDLTPQRESEADRAQLQEQEVHAERLRTLGQIAGGIAHEVNNPAAIAVGGVDLARRHVTAITNAMGAENPVLMRKHLERLDASLRYCEDGTARLAKVARKLSVLSGLLRGDIERLDVNALVRRVVDQLQGDLRLRADLRIDLQPLPALVAHPERLVQVLSNLLVNAAQAIKGVPTDHQITLSTRSNGGEIEIVVADTGVGMPQATLDRIFEPFYTTRSRDEGSGLGLAVVFDVVRQHRGRIDVRSEPNQGTRFTLTLPLKNGLGPGGAGTPTPTARARILVVDDEPFLLAILAEILSIEHDVVAVGGGPEALALLGTDLKFDALLCDLMMPNVDGIAVHRFLLEHAPALAARTVFATGGAFTPRTAGYVASRGVPVLVKPFTAEHVRDALANALSIDAPAAPSPTARPTAP